MLEAPQRSPAGRAFARLRQPRSVPLLALPAFLLVAVLTRPDAWGRPLAYDAGHYLYDAQVVLSGGTPYADVADNKGPVLSLVFAPIELVANGSAVIVQASLVLAVVATAAALMSYVGRYAGRSAGVLAGLTFAALAAMPAYEADEPNTEGYGVALLATALALAGRGPRAAAFAGAAAAAAVLLNPAFAPVLAVVVLEACRGAWVRRFAAGVAGGLLVSVPIVAWLAAGGALDDFSEQVLSQRESAIDFKYLFERLRATGGGYLVDVPARGVLTVGGIGCLFALRARRLRWPAVVLGSWIALVYLRIKLGGYAPNPHYWYLLLPPVAGGLALGAAALPIRPPRRQVAGAVAAAVLAAVVVIRPQLAALDAPPPAPGSLARTYELAEPVADAVARHTEPGETVYVGSGLPAVQWMADRRAPSRYVEIPHPRWRPPDALDELRAAVLQRPPAALVALEGLEPPDPNVPLLLERFDYRPVSVPAGARVWVRGDRP